MKIRLMVCWILCLVLVSVGIMALADVPSRTTQDTTVVTGVVGEDGEETDLDVEADPENEDAQEELDNIADFIRENGAPPADYFGDDAKRQMSALLPPGTDLDGLELNEFTAMRVGGYDNSQGTIRMEILFATPYRDGQAVVAVVGVKVNGRILWTPVPTEVVDGVVQVTLSPELMTMISANGSMMLAVLSEPI